MQGVTKFVANRNLPLALKEDISRHLEGSQVIRNEQDEGDVFSRLSHTLQVWHRYTQVLVRNTIAQGAAVLLLLHMYVNNMTISTCETYWVVSSQIAMLRLIASS